MHILKVSLAIVALAAPVASARAQEGDGAATAAPAPEASMAAPAGQGWNDTWGLLFNLSLYDSLVSPFQNVGIGAQYYLGPDMAVRLGLGYYRTSNPVGVHELVDETAGTRIVTYSMDDNVGTDSSTFLGLTADFLYRLTLNNVAPYAGGGLWVSTDRTSLDYTNDSEVVNQVTTRKAYDRETEFGIRGFLGAEWRLHPSFSLFAEYYLTMTLARQQSSLDETVTEVTIDGVRTVSHESDKMSVKSSFQTQLGSGGTAGVAVHF